MPAIAWEDPFCGEGANCFRLGTDSREALRALISDIKAGKADHLL
ncbi:hypothetical protein ACIRLA_38340 [Streptomyces sp. NPDC102364]